ncbi:Phosphatidylethanolamine-binding -like protein F40A3.3 [Halotydeus destructor]|nr:Phosphatidylethanolamine-binding -like protein F40A3.3 [Halotydeus destructor]
MAILTRLFCNAISRKALVAGIVPLSSRGAARCLTVKAARQSMEKESVIPDVIDVLPKDILEVRFPSGAVVKAGNELTPTQVKDVPTELSWPTEDGALYTLYVTDPDAPSRLDPKYREWHHWLVVNIPANEVGRGRTIYEYVGAGPPKGTGLHRYVYLAFKQPKELNPDEPLLPNKGTGGEGRGGLSVRKFASKYELGNPVAGNFYQAQWDEYVPLLYKQLGGDA